MRSTTVRLGALALTGALTLSACGGSEPASDGADADAVVRLRQQAGNLEVL